MSRLTIIAPAYNEEQVIDEFYTRLSSVLKTLSHIDTEILFVNDGSTDRTFEKIRAFRKQDRSVSYINLSRNFGKEAAMSAGLDYAEGDAVVILDIDLQDPPELIPKMIELWQEGYDSVYGQRSERQGESFIKKFTARHFYRLMEKVSRVQIPRDTGDFRLLSRRAVLALRQLNESNRFMKGIFSWIGYRQTALIYTRKPRSAGNSKFSYWRLWNFALDGITSFTTLPLKVASYLGGALALGSFVYGAWIIINTLVYGQSVPGYPSLMVVILFLGGVQLLSLGVMGEYLGRMFDETKHRPLYLIDEKELNEEKDNFPLHPENHAYKKVGE